MKKTRLLLADDHQILLDGLRRLLCRSYEIVGTARDGRELVALASQCQPDVIVTDPGMMWIRSGSRSHSSCVRVM
jgi:DNA-binding NarL/FixJ family response regulator